MIKKEVTIGDCRLLLGDCMEIIPLLDKVDAVVTDPPYGINAGRGIGRSDRLRCKDNEREWDVVAVDVAHILALNIPTVIWGGNYFNLPPTRGYLIWDKNNSGRDFADCELAWTNQDSNARMKTLRPMNMDGGKLHPTQKPISIMKWCIDYLPYAETILDCYMGSGSTLVACAKMGRKGIGIELDEDYFNIAVKRIQEAYDSPDLFVPAPVKPEQEVLF